MICCTCNQEKTEEEMVKNSSRKNGYSSYCKKCWRDYNSEIYKNSNKRRKQIRENSNKNRIIKRNFIREYLLGKSCLVCGVSDVRVLDFHHRNPKEKEHGVSSMVFYSIKKIMKEIEKCDIICSNCHRILHYDESNNR